MSGFVVGFGKPERDTILSAYELIEHRGTYIYGCYESDCVVMMQNYLNADIQDHVFQEGIPIGSGLKQHRRICYDGQISHRNTLPIGPMQSEEHAVLECYDQFGVDMFQYLTDAIYAFVISDGLNFLAARDLLGIKTLFYGRDKYTLYFASELKSITHITDEVYEFPAGYYLTGDGEFVRFSKLPTAPEKYPPRNVEQIAGDVRSIITDSIRARVDFSHPTASLLSGGIDSSVICLLANELAKEICNKDFRLKTFSLGVDESEDITCARTVAECLGTEHHEVIVDLDDLLGVLPEVIFYLEHFDPSLVRSAVSNFLISRAAKEDGVEVLLSGEGGDEIFCGYSHMKSMDSHQLYAGQIKVLELLHNNAALRLDRMNQCHSIKVVAPLISGELLSYSLTSIAPEHKIKNVNGETIEKWIFRKTFEESLPSDIIWRVKQEFSQGSGSASSLTKYFEETIGDEELLRAQKAHPIIRNKEELHYFRIFTYHFGSGRALDTVGQWLSV